MATPTPTLLSRLHRRRQAGGQRQGRIAREEHGRQLTPLVAPRGLAAPGSGPAAHEHSATRQRTGKRCRRSRLPGPDADRLASEHLPQGGRLMPTAFVPSSGRFCHHLLTRMRSLERQAPRSDRAREASSASGPLLTSAGRSKGGCWRANRRHEATTAPPRSCGRDSNRMRRGQQLACRLLAENHAAVRIAEPIGRVRLAAAPIRSIRSGPLSPASCPRDSPEAAAGRKASSALAIASPLLAACHGTEGSSLGGFAPAARGLRLKIARLVSKRPDLVEFPNRAGPVLLWITLGIRSRSTWSLKFG